ncbi:MAG TPA: HAMP domain-containing sensor histidine kinase [Bryobacteraceae bacterium]|jgi:two-component system sensor histidine kinase CpxA
MKLRTKILLCAALNLALLAIALAAFAGLQFRIGLKSVLLAPGQTHLRDLGDEISDNLAMTPRSDWNALLASRARDRGIDLVLSFNDGNVLAQSTANATPLPEEVLRRMHGPPRDDGPRDRRADGQDGPPGPPPPPPPPPADGRPGSFLVAEENPPAYWFGLRIPVQLPDTNNPRPGTLLVRASSIFFTPILFDWRPWLLGAAALTLITLACWIPFIRGLTNSVRQITGAAEQIAEGRFDAQTDVHRRDEIGHLSDALHRMAAQLHGLVSGQKRFLGDIAHELCAPISRAQMAVGILEARAEPSQKRHVDTVQEEVAHMSVLVNELLQFSKAGFENRSASVEPMQVKDLVARVVDREGPVELIVGADLKVLADPEGIFRALSNLVRNALRYAGEHGPVRISAHADGDDVLISVADEGPGLPEEALERVFTPFFRVDPSRSRDSGGTGLGLSIVKTCVEASGGSVLCRNRKPQGLEVILRLRAVR